jgi:4-carboxymuconolactone decarboxylase
MSKKGKPRAASDAQTVKLPEAVAQIAREHPDLWAAFQRLGEEASQAGPLDTRTRRLIHIAYAIAAGSEGATHSHARRAVAEGLDQAELDHVALLAITAMGWSQAIKGLTWVRDVMRGKRT